MNPKFFRNGIVMLVLVVGTAALLFTWIQSTTPGTPVGYSQVPRRRPGGQGHEGHPAGRDADRQAHRRRRPYTVVVPSILTEVYAGHERRGGQAGNQTARRRHLHGEPAPDTSWLGLLLTGLLPLLVIGGFIFFMMRQAQGTNNQALSFGKSRARMFLGNKTVVTFNDVAGVDEAKTELQEVVEFLKYPEKFNSLGARIPRGVLLVGPPGTGKTLMARAVAGEAGVPFFSISGSEFVEMFVGVGASRVRDLFDQAKRNSPCIVFVDEIDAVGRQRGAGLGGSHDEREQTLNQILVEMDGFDTNTNVIVVAATNRPDVLDPALLRPGRFDRQVILDRPDMNGRTEILKVHTKGKPLDKGVEVEGVARQSPGFSGADLANLVNEAAILAARRNKKVIGMSEFQEALERIVAGPERKSRVISDAEKAIIAYHEGGHAVVQRILPKCDPVAKVTIISRGMALGYTMALPTGGPLPPVQDRVRGQDRRAARRQRRRAADLRRHDDRLQQRHREGDRPGAPDGHRVRDERQARPALVRQARRARVPRPRDRRAAQLQRRGRQDHRRGGPRDHRQGVRAGDRGPDRPPRQADGPGREARRRGDRRLRGVRGAVQRPAAEGGRCTGSRPSSAPASRSRSRPPSPPEPWPSPTPHSKRIS